MPKYIILLLTALLFNACIRKVENPSWKSNVLVPVANTKLDLNNFLKDTLISTNQDSSLSLVTSIPFEGISFDTLIKFDTITFDQSYNLQTLKINGNKIRQRFTLGQLLANNPLGGLITNSHGTTIDPFVAGLLPQTFDLGPIGPLDYDASAFFKIATIKTGLLTVEITNNLPVDILDASFRLINKIRTDTVLAKDNIQIIGKGATSVFKDSLNGKTVESTLQALIKKMLANTDRLKTEIIDTSAAITIDLTLSEITVSDAEAVFPPQNVIDEKTNISFEKMGKYEIKNTKLKSGKVVIHVESTAQDTLYFDYIIPSITAGGVPFTTSEKVNPATPSAAAVYDKVFDFTDWNLDLSKKAIWTNGVITSYIDTVNTFQSILVGRIESNGKIRHLTLADYLKVNLTMKDLVAAEATGYLGDTTISISGETVIEDFKKYNSSVVNFEKANLSLKINNGIGVPLETKINNFTAENTTKNTSISLNGQAATSFYTIAKATDNPFTIVPTTIPINETNSNLNQLVSVLPDKIKYNVQVKLNPSGTKVYDNFLKKESVITPELELTIPLNIEIKDWTLRDTSDFSIAENNNLNNIGSGSFKLIVENGFPLNAKPTLYFLDKDNKLTDSLTTVDNILPASSDINGKVSNLVKSVTSFPFTAAQFNNIKSAKKVYFKVALQTPAQKFVKFYSNYKLNLVLSGDFEYTIKTNE